MSNTFPDELNRLQDVAEFALKYGKQKGATDLAVIAGISRGLSVDVRLGELETASHYRDHEFGVSLFLGKKSASVSISDLSKEAVESAIIKAVSIAGFAEEDPYGGLADPSDLAATWPELSLYHPWDISVEEAAVLGKKLEGLAMETDPRIQNSEGASVSPRESALWYAASNGFSSGTLSSRHSLSVSVIAKEKDKMQRDSDYTLARSSDDFESLESVAKRAANGAVNRLGARRPKTGKYPILFRSDIAGNLIGSFLSAISGGALYQKQSFLLDHLGRVIFPDFMEIVENPFVPKGLASTPYDNEGVRVCERKLIDEGILQGYLLSSYSARRLGMKTTGNAGGVHNVLVKSTGESFDDLLKKMGTGILVTELFGQGVNLMTGDYSRGAFGFWVENGEIQYPIEEFTIASHLKKMFSSIIGIGTDLEKRRKVQVGSILIQEMVVAARV